VDHRDPRHRIRSSLLTALGLRVGGSDAFDRREAYIRDHPEFTDTYEHVLQLGLDHTLHSRELVPIIAAHLKGKSR